MEADIRLEHELLAIESEHTVHAMLELTAPAVEGERPTPPLHLALAIDRSGSMSGPKLDAAKRAAAFLAHHLGPNDALAVVTYDDQVRLVAPLAPVEPHLFPALESVVAEGTTNLSGGWLKAREELGRGQDPAATRRVLLLTDGLANVGITDHPTLVQMAASAAAECISTTTIGFGEDFDEELLTTMADAGRGGSYYASGPDEAPGIFAQEFEGLASVVAQNLSVEIRPTDDVNLLGILNEYPSIGVPGGVQVQLGDVFAKDRLRVVLRLHVPSVASLGVRRIADVVVRYVAVGPQVAAHELVVPIVVNLVSADEAAAAAADAEVTEQVVVLRAAEAQRRARTLADAGDFAGAREVLRSTAEALGTLAPGSPRADELLQQAGWLEESAAAMSSAMYTPDRRKLMHYRAHQTRRGRVQRAGRVADERAGATDGTDGGSGGTDGGSDGTDVGSGGSMC
jgi:Ca-activated chloride channel family protein